MIWIYLVISIIIIIILFRAYVRISHPFWSTQPIFHMYNVLYYMKSFCFIYDSETPFPYSKYVDSLIQIERNPEENTIQPFIQLIQNHYMKTNSSHYKPSKESLQLALSSFHEEFPCYIAYKTNSVDQSIFCCLTSRPIHVYIHEREYMANYVDYLCIHKDYRKKGYAEKLIYSYACHAKQDSKLNMFIFKKENGHHPCIVPLVQYTSFIYDIRNWDEIYMDIEPMKIDFISKDNIHIFREYYSSLPSYFQCSLFSSLEYLIKSIEIKDTFLIVLRKDTTIYGIYFFRDAYTSYTDTYHEKHNIIECIGSILMKPESIDIFRDAFVNIVCMCREKYNFHYMILDHCNHNTILYDSIEYEYEVQASSSFYMYNFICRTYAPEDVFIYI